MMDIIDWQLDYIEDWSTGKCVSAMHGPPDCTLDRWQLCAKRMLSSSDAWAFVHCNFVQRLNLCGTPELAAPVDDDESGPVTNCTIGDQEIKVLQGCTASLSSLASFEALHSCAYNNTSAEWAKASGAAASAAGAPPPMWVTVDGVKAPARATNLTQWAAAVKSNICTTFAAKAPKAVLPAACS